MHFWVLKKVAIVVSDPTEVVRMRSLQSFSIGILFLAAIFFCCGDFADAQVMSGVTDPAELATLSTLPSCMASAQAGYKRPPQSPPKTPSKCTTTIDRANPISPLTFAVPPGNIVYVRLWDTRQNENVTFVVNATNNYARYRSSNSQEYNPRARSNFRHSADSHPRGKKKLCF